MPDEPTYATQIEAMIGTELLRETRAGVVHFKPGQLGARRLVQEPDDVVSVVPPPEAYELWFVNGMGEAWLVLFDRKADGSWFPWYGFRGQQTTLREVAEPVRPGGGVPEAWRVALDKAYEEATG